jgi:hypothetical protein
MRTSSSHVLMRVRISVKRSFRRRWWVVSLLGLRGGEDGEVVGVGEREEREEREGVREERRDMSAVT